MNQAKIDKLIECISNCTEKEYVSFITNLGLTLKDFEGSIHYSDKKYTRTCIAKKDNFELILLAWSKGQKSPIHNHDIQEGFIYVIDGEVKEVRYHFNTKTKEFEKLGESIVKENKVTYTAKDFNGFHSIENISNKNTLTLHLYKKPIEKCMVVINEELVEKTMAYDYTV